MICSDISWFFFSLQSQLMWNTKWFLETAGKNSKMKFYFCILLSDTTFILTNVPAPKKVGQDFFSFPLSFLKNADVRGTLCFVALLLYKSIKGFCWSKVRFKIWLCIEDKYQLLCFRTTKCYKVWPLGGTSKIQNSKFTAVTIKTKN